MKKSKDYKLILKQEGLPDEIRLLDYLNAIIIPAELKLAFPEQFKSGKMSVNVEKIK